MKAIRSTVNYRSLINLKIINTKFICNLKQMQIHQQTNFIKQKKFIAKSNRNNNKKTNQIMFYNKKKK